MWIKGDLLLLATGGVHVAVRVEVTALGVVVAERDTRSEYDICGYILHALAVEGGLKLGRHETIAVAGIDEAEEVNREHAHVEGDWNDNQAEDTGEEVLEPNALGMMLVGRARWRLKDRV